MRFALLGDHPDGLDMAAALVDSGRHEVAACTAALGEAVLARLKHPRRCPDVEEVLADPAIDAVIVAGAPAVRAAQLRRALQSERHVLCVHPADDSPDVGYEADLLRRDTGCVLMPLLPEALHPSFRRLAELIDQPAEGQQPRSPLGALELLRFERSAAGEVLENTAEGLSPSVAGWDVLRRLGGEVVEVLAFAEGEELAAGAAVLVAGRFEKGGVLGMTLLPRRGSSCWRLVATGTAGEAELTFPQGWHGPALLEWRDAAGGRHEEHQERFDAWPGLVEAFEAAVGRTREGGPPGPSWQDALRALELDDAARRSVSRRRASAMDYQEVSEEVGFKGTMTLLGCGLLWAVLLLLITSRWLPWAGWLILPLLLAFIVLQLLRYVIPPAKEGVEPQRHRGTEKTEER
jgi:predicted dehydrogenase